MSTEFQFCPLIKVLCWVVFFSLDSKLSKYKIRILCDDVDKNTSQELPFQMYTVPLIEAGFSEVSVRYG